MNATFTFSSFNTVPNSYFHLFSCTNSHTNRTVLFYLQSKNTKKHKTSDENIKKMKTKKIKFKTNKKSNIKIKWIWETKQKKLKSKQINETKQNKSKSKQIIENKKNQETMCSNPIIVTRKQYDWISCSALALTFSFKYRFSDRLTQVTQFCCHPSKQNLIVCKQCLTNPWNRTNNHLFIYIQTCPTIVPLNKQPKQNQPCPPTFTLSQFTEKNNPASHFHAAINSRKEINNKKDKSITVTTWLKTLNHQVRSVSFDRW